MRNLIIFLSTFTFTVLIVIFSSSPANAGGAGGSWGCPDGFQEEPTGGCSFVGNNSGGGGGTGGGGAGGSWGADCWKVGGGSPAPLQNSPIAVCRAYGGAFADCSGLVISDSPPKRGTTIRHPEYSLIGTFVCDAEPDFIPDPVPEPPPFPDIPPPTPDCNVCQSLYEIKLKLNVLKNQDIKYINQNINNMSQTINNIDNSITSLNVEMNTVNNNLMTINNNMGDLITNIENNNITNNEILNTVNNIDNSMADYSLKLGDIELALGDIDLKLDNTNKLVLDLGFDIEFIKNKLVNDDSKDYTDKLNEIIDLLQPCVPTETTVCPATFNDKKILEKLKELNDLLSEEFTPDDSSTTIDIEDKTDIDLDSGLISFGAPQCPPDEPINTMVNGYSFTDGFSHQPLCNFFTRLSPFIRAFGGFSAALILGGGLRRG